MGWILGPYEKGAPARFADSVPEWFGKNLLDGGVDRLLPHLEEAMRRMPGLELCDIKAIANVPISRTRDGSHLAGPAWGVRNVWLNEGHRFGVTAAGGAGWQLVNWIVDGEATVDMLAMDPRRCGPYTNKRYVVAKNEEALARAWHCVTSTRLFPTWARNSRLRSWGSARRLLCLWSRHWIRRTPSCAPDGLGGL